MCLKPQNEGRSHVGERHKLTNFGWPIIKPLLPNKPCEVPRIKWPVCAERHFLDFVIQRAVVRAIENEIGFRKKNVQDTIGLYVDSFVKRGFSNQSTGAQIDRFYRLFTIK